MAMRGVAWIALIAALAVGAAGGVFFTRNRDLDVDTLQAQQAEWERNLKRLETSVLAMEEIVQAKPTSPVGAPVPLEVEDPQDIADLRTSQDAILNELATMRKVIENVLKNQAELNPLILPEGYRQPKVEGAVNALLQRLQQSRSEVYVDMFCKVPGQVYRQYGAPDAVQLIDGQPRWQYFGAGAGAERYIVDIGFIDGVVVDIKLTKVAG